MRRAAAPAAAVVCLGAFNLLAPHLPEPRTWGQIAGLALRSPILRYPQFSLRRT